MDSRFRGIDRIMNWQNQATAWLKLKLKLTKDPMSHNLTIALPVYESGDSIADQIESVRRLHGVRAEVLLFDERLQRPPDGSLERVTEQENVRYFSQAHRNRAALFNDALEVASNDLVAVLPADILLEPEFATQIIKAFEQDPELAMVYSDYVEVTADGSVTTRSLFPYEGQIDERFPLGFVHVYDRRKVHQVGGFCEDYDHAEEYDVRLKFWGRFKVGYLDKPLYRCTMREESRSVDPALSKLHSPGEGARGGFSYLFYTPEMEREIEFVFKQFLQRIGAYLTHRNAVVEYDPGEVFPVAVSIVIPILNRRRFIRRTIQTVLDGTFENFEILVVDNGSSDGTQEEVRSISDPRVRLIENNGTCIADALNRGIREARGKYIAQLDSDDEYLPDTLETMVAYMESHPRCGLAISYYDLIDEESQPLTEFGVIKHLEYDRNNILRVDGAGALRFFHKKVLFEFGLYDEANYGNFGEDYDMVLKISEKYDVDRVHKVLYRYRRHPDNTDVTREPIMKVRNKNHARQMALKRRTADFGFRIADFGRLEDG
jgi:glycosyltransferase involved in cell wall biosynthesis